MADNLTVKDIAERIRRPHEEMTTVNDRIRGWTDMGFLAGIGDKHPGRGARRIYSELAVIHAMLLTGLLDAGVPVVRADAYRDTADVPVLGLGTQAVRQMQADPSTTQWLVIFGRKPPARMGAHSAYWCGGENPKIFPDAQWTVVININVLFKDVQIGEANG